MVSRAVPETRCLDENTKRSDESKVRCLFQEGDQRDPFGLSIVTCPRGDRRWSA